MLRYYYILILFAVSLYTNAQTDHAIIRQKILEEPVTKDDLIFKGRQLLVDRFEAMQFDSVRMFIDFFDVEIDNGSYQSLWPVERILLYYWTRQYDRLIDYVARLKNEPRYEHHPSDSRVGEMLSKWSVRDFDILEEWIDESERSEEDKSFLKMILESLLAGSPQLDITQEKLNEHADMFITKYPYSAYNDLVKEYVVFKTALSDWGFGYGFYAGYTLENNDYFNPRFALAMDLKLHYRKAHLILFMDVGFGKLQQDVPGTDWIKGEKAPVMSMGASLGYAVFEWKQLRFAPFAGFSYNIAEPVQKQVDMKPELKGLEISGMSSIVGINADWKMNSIQDVGTPMLACINLKVAWIPQVFRREDNIYKGDLVYITVGFSFDFFRMKMVSK